MVIFFWFFFVHISIEGKFKIQSQFYITLQTVCQSNRKCWSCLENSFCDITITFKQHKTSVFDYDHDTKHTHTPPCYGIVLTSKNIFYCLNDSCVRFVFIMFAQSQIMFAKCIISNKTLLEIK